MDHRTVMGFRRDEAIARRRLDRAVLRRVLRYIRPYRGQLVAFVVTVVLASAATPAFADDPKLVGAPVGWTLTISDVTLSAGAGFVVAIAGAMMLMPWLGKVPQAQKLDVDDQGRAIGMEY